MYSSNPLMHVFPAFFPLKVTSVIERFERLCDMNNHGTEKLILLSFTEKALDLKVGHSTWENRINHSN